MSAETPERDELLQQYLDGELSGEEAHLVEEMLSSDDHLAEDAETYRRIGDLVRALAVDEEEAREAEEVTWKAVSRRVARPETAASGDGPSPAGVWLSEFLHHRKRYWIPMTGSIAAAAAVLAIVMSLPPAEPVPAPLPAPMDLHSRVTDMTLNSATAIVFEVETGSGGTAAILWDTAEDEGTESEEETDSGEE